MSSDRSENGSDDGGFDLESGVLSNALGFDWPRLLLWSLTAAVAIALLVTGVTSTVAFNPYNPTWDGATDVHERVAADPDVERELVSTTAQYETLEANGTVAFVVAPGEPYDDADGERVRRFVEDGGTLVVFDNFGDAGNGLLSAVGAEARTNGQLLRDERHHARGPAMPIATGVENHTTTADIEQLTLNHATAVEPGNATVLVTTSDYAYLGDEDDALDEQDDLGSYPVATVENVSEGRVIVVGDPSLTINAMLAEPDNAAFLRGLYADGDRVAFDVSHTSDLPPLTATALTVRELPHLQVLIGAIGIGVVTLAPTRRGRSALETVRRWVPSRRAVDRDHGRDLGLTDDQRAAFLRRRHPDWDEDRIRRVLAATSRSESEPPGGGDVNSRGGED